MVPIVTQCDESFLPGLLALYNSYLRHSAEGFSFHAFFHGSAKTVDYLRGIGIDVLADAPFPTDKYPTSRYYPVANPIMYKNLLMPDLFSEHEKSIYIDTDSLILRNLQPLVDIKLGDKVLAATRCNGNRASNYAPCPAEDANGYGPMTSLMIFNHRPFKQKKVLERCAAAMEMDGMTWHMIGQGVLHYVVRSDWHQLPWHTQAHAGHDTYFTAPKSEIYSLHFMGTKPWREFSDPAFITPRKLALRELWKQYAA